MKIGEHIRFKRDLIVLKKYWPLKMSNNRLSTIKDMNYEWIVEVNYWQLWVFDIIWSFYFYHKDMLEDNLHFRFIS